MSGDVVARAKAALDATRCTDEMQEFFRVGFVRELVEELEMQTSLQGLSVQIPEYGEWGSETLLCLFQDFGIQPGDGYQEASSRQGDLLRSLAAANAEVEKLRAALETIRCIANKAAGVGWRDVTSQSCDEAAGMQSVGEEILAAIERAGIEP